MEENGEERQQFFFEKVWMLNWKAPKMRIEETLIVKEVEKNDDHDEKDEEGRAGRRGRNPFFYAEKKNLWKKFPEKRHHVLITHPCTERTAPPF